MAKKQTPVPVVETPTLADLPIEIHPDVQADIERKGSVVKRVYKQKYAERAKDQGLGKLAQRSAWDWLAQTLAGEVLDDQKRLMVSKFEALMDANGVDHSRWTNRSVGWQGRLRMTGRLALQKVVAETGVLKTTDGETLEAPADWIAKYRN